MGLDEFKVGVYKPTQEEIDEAAAEGPKALEELMAKFDTATGRLRDAQGDKAVGELEDLMNQKGK